MFQHNGKKTSGFYEKDFKPIHQEKAHCIKERPRMNATTNKNKGDDFRHSISFD